ncbi:hypothetical protein [Parvicella tangerina]|uniref:Uncharacterized protein n=1 Tax=Parvicella tangerina TaxID=2829795 RepID=A0A916JLG5_9FLAO|nr:hypothetical protein [Parvicella tangerina]CAG5080258.1 hypothetical protein CRYO30217_01236 [Parvicella tangerina]
MKSLLVLFCVFAGISNNIYLQKNYCNYEGSDFISIKPNFEYLISVFREYVLDTNSSLIEKQIDNYQLIQKTTSKNQKELTIIYLHESFGADTLRKVTRTGCKYIIEANGITVETKVDKNGCLKKLRLYSEHIKESRHKPDIRIRKKGHDLYFITNQYVYPKNRFSPYPIFNDVENLLYLFSY